MSIEIDDVAQASVSESSCDQPYVGSRPFYERDRLLFFGRDQRSDRPPLAIVRPSISSALRSISGRASHRSSMPA